MLIVGIAGGTGSGKTTVVNKVMAAFPNNEVIMIPQDSYYRDNSSISLAERQKINFDHPDSIEFGLLIEHLKQLRKGKALAMPLYSYITVKPSHLQFIEPSRRYADIILPGGGENQIGIEVLVSIIEKHLLKSKS
jgi:uridine kinase